MYWSGVEEEITQMVLSLAEWQSARFKGIELPDEHDDNIHGLDTFVDQVSQSSREYASDYGIKLPEQYMLTELFAFCEPLFNLTEGR